MSVEALLKDAVEFNFTGVEKRLLDYWLSTLEPALRDLAVKFSTDEGKILWAAATAALADVVGGKTIVQAAEDAWAVVSSQTPSLALADLQDAIGIQARAATPTT